MLACLRILPYYRKLLIIGQFSIVQWISIQTLQMTIFILITGRRCHRRQVHQSSFSLQVNSAVGKHSWMVAVWVSLKVQWRQPIVFRIEICFRISLAIYTFIRKPKIFFNVVNNLLKFILYIFFIFLFYSTISTLPFI